VELGEIEAALGQHPAVAAASVVLREDTGEPRLVAYLVARELAAPPTDLRPFLRDRLPDYMLPAVSVWLPALPLTPNGKVDRAALPAPSATVRGKGTTQRIGKRSSPSPLVGEGAGGEGIRSPLERQLVRIWEQVLGVESVGIHDNFFDLGGHSLLTVRLADQIRRETGQSLPLSAIFQGGTVAQVAELLLGGAESLLWSPLVPIQTRGTRPPFFCVHPLLGVVFPYYELARQLGPDQPFYGLQAAGFDGTRPPLSQVEAMARHYLEALRVVQPEGPYRLGGWSFGSLVAFEMARQLSAQGQRVALLAVIDTPAPVEGHRITPLLLAQFAVAMLRISGRHIWPYLLEYMRLATTVDAHAGAGPGRWAAHRLLGQFAGLPAATNDDTLRALLFQQPTLRPLARVAVANARAAMRYQPQPYAGNIALIATETPAGSAAHPLQGWDRIAASVTRIIAPGNHLTLLQPPHVAPLAAQLRALLDT
jgi:thioesterase domain-containing protein